MRPETMIGSEWAQGYGEALRNRWGFVLTTRRRKYFMMTTSPASAAQWMASIERSAESWKQRQAEAEAAAAAAAAAPAAPEVPFRPFSEATFLSDAGSRRSRPATQYSVGDASSDDVLASGVSGDLSVESASDMQRWSFTEMHLAVAATWGLPTRLSRAEPLEAAAAPAPASAAAPTAAVPEQPAPTDANNGDGAPAETDAELESALQALEARMSTIQGDIGTAGDRVRGGARLEDSHVWWFLSCARRAVQSVHWRPDVVIPSAVFFPLYQRAQRPGSQTSACRSPPPFFWPPRA